MPKRCPAAKRERGDLREAGMPRDSEAIEVGRQGMRS